MESLRGKVYPTCDHKRRRRCNMDNAHSTIWREVRYNQGYFLGIILEDKIIYSNSIMSTKENLFYICEEGDILNILIYGAGVIGSIFANKLSLSGENVTILARGDRYSEIKSNGVVLINPKTGKREVAKVSVTETLEPNNVYDYIFVVMQRTQVEDVLPILSQNKSSNIVFMVNTALGYADYADKIDEKRIIIGFPSAGGERKNGEVHYFIGRGLMRAFQTTKFGEYHCHKTERVNQIIKMFNQAGIPSVYCNNMDAWQKTHVAIVTSIGNSLYGYNCSNYELSRAYFDVAIMVKGIKEGFSVLKALKIKITPSKLNYFTLPTFLLARIFKIVMGTQLAEVTMAKHTSVAQEEMIYLQNEFDELIKKSMISTPNIDKLRINLYKQNEHNMCNL
ncbi:ketopantoate reductase family protein [Tissierella carlieri]|uniref:ketopantoate reductase family protein n=1 Tax=Tissierella carlieri TaxID=689904 RepID=UPI001C10BCD7|nr:2-dehydropantoate 2-reductase N-terminal domain-containing protein [Tissierella carlieri]